MLVYKETRAVLQKMADELKKEWNLVIGNSDHTINVEFTIYKTNIRMYITSPEETIFIEKGRGAGKFPPVTKIADWVSKKYSGEPLPRQKQLSFLIGKKIAEHGTEGKQQLFKIIDRLNGKYEMLIFDALKKDVSYHVRSLEIKLNKIFSKL